MLLCACYEKETAQAIDFNRNDAFFEDYAEYVIINIQTAQNGSFDVVKYAQKHSKRNTQEVVSGMLSKLAKRKTVNAYANVFQMAEGGYQCVIVHRNGVSESVMDHERGHCMKRVLFKIIQTQHSEIYDSFAGDDKYGTYLSEGFAEIAALTRAYSLDGDFSYLSQRLIEIQRKASYQDGYKASVPLLLQARDYLKNVEQLPAGPEAQIKFMIDTFYLSHVLTRDAFDAGQWWGWLK